MVPFFKTTIITDRSFGEIMGYMAQNTIPTGDYRNYGRIAEFRGCIGPIGFMVMRNSYLKNSFAPIAKAKLFPTGRKTEVRLHIGIPMFTFVFMCLWSCGVLFGLVVCIPQIFQSDSMFAVSVFALFMLVAIVLVCFCFYIPYRKIKSRMFEIPC